MPNLLVVDADHSCRTILRAVLSRSGRRVLVAGDAGEALACLAEGGIGLVVAESHPPSLDGLMLLRAIRAAHPTLRLLMLSPDADLVREVAARDGILTLPKQTPPTELLRAVADLLAPTG